MTDRPSAQKKKARRAVSNTPVSGGLKALVASTKMLAQQRATNLTSFVKVNRPGGFDCPGCAWPDPHDASHLEFCENGVKAIVHEITNRRADPHFFAKHAIDELETWSAYQLEKAGRLTHPMRLDRASGHYRPVSWEEAFGRIGEVLQGLNSADDAVFYTSGRTSNEAAFLYQLFCREFGTNNLPDCSNMCHESSGVALGESIGIGKGTVTLEDFKQAEAVFIIGQNPGTNHPRMLATLQDAVKRGCKVVSINPLVEPGLVKFIHPKNTSAVLRNKPDIISDLYLQPLVGGDLALLKGMIKCLLEAEEDRPGEILDHEFIKQHTDGFASMKVDIRDTSWEDIVNGSGLSREEIANAASIYMESKRTIICWAMGLTQQKQAVGTLQTLVNLLLLKGNIGKPGAGACPVRGHSNVQGDRTMGIIERPKPEFLDALERVFGIDTPREAGLNTVESIEAMKAGKVRVFLAMGGNFAAATPDQVVTEAALASLDLTVQVSTKLNRSHIVTGREAYILPCLGRSEMDRQLGKTQEVTVEDSMSMVHASRGHKKPASRELLSEAAIVAGLARAAMPNTKIDWAWLVEDYSRIRNKIEETMPGAFGEYNRRIKQPGGFYLGNSARDRNWMTATGKARFIVRPLPDNTLEEGQLRLMTMRSHDQFNTTIYGLDDRYRGVKGTRRVVFFNSQDLVERGLVEGEQIDLTTRGSDGMARAARGFEARMYNIPKGCAAAYFPETNALVPLNSYADRSYTPTSKFIPVWVHRAEAGSEDATSSSATSIAN